MRQSRLILGIFIILLGLNFLFDFPFVKVLFAGLIIWMGIRILTGQTGKAESWMSRTTTKENTYKRVLIFTGADTKIESDDFTGGEIVTIFGGGKFDFSQVKTTQKQVKLEVVAIFGGQQLVFPKNWLVKTDGVGILGGFNNQTSTTSEDPVVAEVKGAAIIGGIDLTTA